MRGLMIAVLFCAVPASVQASWNGNELLRLCRQTDAVKIACLNYVSGVVDGLATGVMMGGSSKLFCPPDMVILDQYVDVTVQYLERHPERRHIYAPRLIVEGLSAAFPCPKP